jgi:hypothetical protein
MKVVFKPLIWQGLCWLSDVHAKLMDLHPVGSFMGLGTMWQLSWRIGVHQAK